MTIITASKNETHVFELKFSPSQKNAAHFRLAIEIRTNQHGRYVVWDNVRKPFKHAHVFDTFNEAYKYSLAFLQCDTLLQFAQLKKLRSFSPYLTFGQDVYLSEGSGFPYIEVRVLSLKDVDPIRYEAKTSDWNEEIFFLKFNLSGELSRGKPRRIADRYSIVGQKTGDIYALAEA